MVIPTCTQKLNEVDNLPKKSVSKISDRPLTMQDMNTCE